MRPICGVSLTRGSAEAPLNTTAAAATTVDARSPKRKANDDTAERVAPPGFRERLAGRTGRASMVVGQTGDVCVVVPTAVVVVAAVISAGEGIHPSIGGDASVVKVQRERQAPGWRRMLSHKPKGIGRKEERASRAFSGR